MVVNQFDKSIVWNSESIITVKILTVDLTHYLFTLRVLHNKSICMLASANLWLWMLNGIPKYFK